MRSTPIRILVFVLASIWLFGNSILSLLVDWNWFEAIGHVELLSTRVVTAVVLWLGAFISISGFVFVNIRYASKIEKVDLILLQSQVSDVELSEEGVQRLLGILRWIVVLFPAFVMANVLSSNWLYCLAFLDPVDFGQKDSVFGLDYSFYVFQLPIIGMIFGIAKAVGILTTILVGIQSFVRDIMLGSQASRLHPKAQTHLALLGMVLFALFGVEWFLARYELLFSQNGVVWGAGYADINARIPAYWIMLLLSGVASVTMLISVVQRRFNIAVVGVVAYFIVRILVVGMWPDIVQDYMVAPNELEVEKPYLKEKILSTRSAYALDRISVEPFEASYDLTMKEIDENPLTINNVRVWDDRPLLTTYGQLQEIRTYYDFKDVDIDRYVLDGELRQVMLSARELNYRNVSDQAKSWVNEHFQYTHGYGLTMSPVNLITEEGLPSLFIQDIPPKTTTEIAIERPEIYYGELTNTYVIVGGSVKEFDYPEGDKNVYTNYTGEGGIGIGSFWRKLLFAWHFGNVEMLLSNYIEEDSRILFRRQIMERVQTLAPFLYYDKDPYLVLSEGRMVWIVDAYTTSKEIPYSEPSGRNGFNYIRNSVKVVIDAYNGSVDFYVSDKTDPLIQVYEQIFPNTFIELEQMSEDLRSHLRYPADFFEIQAQKYRAYHMMDETVFYNKEDMWDLPRELYAGQEQRMEAYYLIMKLPEAEEAEFVLLLPFVPTGKDNMISWLAARSDGENYGKLILYQFPKQKLIYGPRQIEARIDQDPEISKQITLWSQSGSRVVRGNLLVIPIGNSLVYVEPLYLQAESSQLPELKRVIVSYDNKISMEKTLDEALLAVFGKRIKEVEKAIEKEIAPVEEVVENTETKMPQLESWQTMAQQAKGLLSEAREAQQAGDWALYGEKLEELNSVLERLEVEALGQEVLSE